MLPTLDAIDALHLLPQGDAERLRGAYLFLRRLENLLQSINDEQTQTLPGDDLNRARLAWAMGEADWVALETTLGTHMTAVRRIFNELIGDDEPDADEDKLAEGWREFWLDACDADVTNPVLSHLDSESQRQVVRWRWISAKKWINAPLARADAMCWIC
ncbi:glutamate-ammonia-ligase adenylyltransferase [Atlantibacter hermannii]|nr:glutamate-ammonia-ligase adenylyltransferase [Atlantibacter hermannii]